MASNSRFYDDRPTLTLTPQLHTITPFYPPFDTLSRRQGRFLIYSNSK